MSNETGRPWHFWLFWAVLIGGFILYSAVIVKASVDIGSWVLGGMAAALLAGVALALHVAFKSCL
jgi:hypothetical protein